MCVTLIGGYASLIQVWTNTDYFICDVIYVVKLYQFGLQEIYCELEKMFLFKHFNSFIDLVDHAHDRLCLT